VSDGLGEGFEFEPSSFDQGSDEMLEANSHLTGAAGQSESVQGSAGGQLRQWLPTVPAAETIDKVEATADEALSQATNITREDAEKLLTQKQTMLTTEARITARIEGIRSGPVSPETGPVDDATPSQIEQYLSAFGARGTASGREYDPEAAGGPIENLDASSAVVNDEGVQAVAGHLDRFVVSGGTLEAPEQGMLERLKAIASGELAPTHYDLNFYTHELREASRYARLGYGPDSDLGSPDMYDVWNNVHTATLEDYGLSGRDLYHPEVAP
jgi:hypothetical protein